MKNTISNSMMSVTVKRHGAELCSLKAADGTEYLWQADPAVWGRHAPLLFPIVGKLAQGRYRFEGKEYALNPHGFARDMDFALVTANATGLSYRLNDTPETRKQYPFEFNLMRHFRLSDGVLEVTTEVTNTGDKVLPFSIGEHPGFALNWGAKDRVEDYALLFEKAERLDAHFLDSNGLVSDQTGRILSNKTVLPLRSDLFDRDALIFLKIKSQKISLCSRRHARRVTVKFSGYPQLGIWAKPGAPFVCIEPWYGHADPASHDGELMNKPGIIKLAPGSVFSCNWRVGLTPKA
ncbi:MAG: aldose 1-epimerase family protein [bacterium]